MSKDSILDYSTTPSENQDINGISILGAAKPSNLDNGMRAEMAHIAKDLVTRRSVKDTAYTAVKTDLNQLLEFSAEATLTTAAAATLTDGWQCKVYAQGGAVTINPNGSETVNGNEFLILQTGGSGILSVNNGNFRFEQFGGGGQSRFHAHKNGTNQTGGDVTVTFTTEVFDVGGVFDTANSRFTPEDGAVYVVYGQIGATITGLGERRTRCRLVRNGDTVVSLGESFSDGSGYSQTPNFTAIVVGNGTDYYTVTADTGSDTYPVQGATEKTYFMAWRIA